MTIPPPKDWKETFREQADQTLKEKREALAKKQREREEAKFLALPPNPTAPVKTIWHSNPVSPAATWFMETYLQLPPPVSLTLPEECETCWVCNKLISPTKPVVKYADGRRAHTVCPGSSWWGGCDRCGKPRMNCDCNTDEGFRRAAFVATHPQGGNIDEP